MLLTDQKINVLIFKYFCTNMGATSCHQSSAISYKLSEQLFISQKYSFLIFFPVRHQYMHYMPNSKAFQNLIQQKQQGQIFFSRKFIKLYISLLKLSVLFLLKNGIVSTLNGNQSCDDIKFIPFWRTYINKMSESVKPFYDLVLRVQQSHQFSKILQMQHQKYHLQPFKIQGVDCQRILKIFDSIVSKYETTHELTQDPQNWNQNQRRVFIWFIIFYTYFLELQHQELISSHWQTLSAVFFNKQPEFLRFQFLNMIKPQAKISWTPEEDQLLVKAVRDQQCGKWNQVAKNIFFNSNYQIFKSPKHCRERWLNHLDTNKKRGSWTASEDLAILKFVFDNGKRWCKIVPALDNSRTEHMIKNRYNSIVSKHRVSKKEREQYLILKIMKQLKKQITNAELRKKSKELKLKEIKERMIEEMPSCEKASQLNASLQKETFIPLKVEQAKESTIRNQEEKDPLPEDNIDGCYDSPVANYFPQINQPYYSFGGNQIGFSYVSYPTVFPFGNIYWA